MHNKNILVLYEENFIQSDPKIPMHTNQPLKRYTINTNSCLETRGLPKQNFPINS